MPPLVAELVRALGNGVRAELIFVDDSDDETPTVVLNAATTAGSAMPIRICHRPVGSREGGLGGAVKRGFEEASGRFVAVMDADLQHPPDLLPALIAKAQSEQVDVVVATRFVDGGTTGKFGWSRRLVSRSSAVLAKLLFPRRLASVSDPMSGFFLVRRNCVDPGVLRPNGFKILLEVLVRSRVRVAEVPYAFGERVAGVSKASLGEGLRYLRHLVGLRLG